MIDNLAIYSWESALSGTKDEYLFLSYKVIWEKVFELSQFKIQVIIFEMIKEKIS